MNFIITFISCTVAIFIYEFLRSKRRKKKWYFLKNGKYELLPEERIPEAERYVKHLEEIL